MQDSNEIFSTSSHEANYADLSPRETEILDLAAEGMTDKAIAHRLKLSIATVGTYWGRIRMKLQASSRAEAVATIGRLRARSSIDAYREKQDQLLAELLKHTKAEEFLRSVIEGAPDALIIADSKYVIRVVNSGATSMFGYDRSEMIGMPLETLMPERFRGRHKTFHRDFILHPHTRRMGAGLHLLGVRKDGREFPIDVALAPIKSEEGTLSMASIRDMSEYEAYAEKKEAPGEVLGR